MLALVALLPILALRQIIQTTYLVEVELGSQTISKDNLTYSGVTLLLCCNVALMQCHYHVNLMQTLSYSHMTLYEYSPHFLQN